MEASGSQNLAARRRLPDVATNGTGYLDLPARNVGIALTTLDKHPLHEILDYFGHPECAVVLSTTQPAHPQVLPPYLVPPISVIDYLVNGDSTFMETPLRAQIMDSGNSRYRVYRITVSGTVLTILISYCR